MTSDDHLDALPEGHRIHEFELLSVLGVGGFGITYLAKDTLLNRTVAIKEYLPRDFVVRTGGHSVRPRSSSESENYTWGLERFLDEARILARLNHPSIIRIHKYFEAHGSGYIVMEYIAGETLNERLKRENTLSESQLMTILNPLVEGLEQVHATGYLHRDITPKNIVLRKDNTPVLIDFGAARQAIGVRSRSVTAVATAGYAPLEQYSTRGKQQGPWTDVYGLSAVAYRCITGVAPKDATERAQGEALTPASEQVKGQYSKGLLTAVDQGLAVKVEDRPQNLKAWCSLWEQKEEQQTTVTEAKEKKVKQSKIKSTAKKEVSHVGSGSRVFWRNIALVSFVVGIVVLSVVGLYTFQAGQEVEELKLAAERGDVSAQFNLGWIYDNGEGIPQDYVEAAKWYQMAAEQGNALAQYMLGEMYLTGKGVLQDDDEAFKWYRMAAEQEDVEALKWFRMAAEQGDTSAQYNLGRIYDNGEGVPQDYVEAVKWYRMAAERGHIWAQDWLGWIYKDGREGVPQDYAEAVKWYRMAAEQGHASAQYSLGKMYHSGEGIPQDYEEVVKWYRMAAEQGHASALSDLGGMYSSGEGVPQNYVEAVKWYRMAAEQGQGLDQYWLGNMYLRGKGVPQDYAEAVKWYRMAAEQGHASAQYSLGKMYHSGEGIPQDYVEAVKWYRMAAAEQWDASDQYNFYVRLVTSMNTRGHVIAQYNLGVMYGKGHGVPQDDAEAVKWYRMAAEQGDPDAQYNLGVRYGEGRGVPQDDTEAVKWYRMAAEQGDPDAQYNLGVRYGEGRGVPQDDTEAVKWYRMAAEQGHIWAQYDLGVMYGQGHGVPQDDAEAVKWHRMAAEQGDPDAQYSLGVRYGQGRGVPQDYAEAAKWTRLAAEQGRTWAQYKLGIMYDIGRGVAQSYIEAHKWYNLAASRFSSDDTDQSDKARKYRDEIEGKMTQEAITTAQRLAREWQPKTWDQLKAE